MSDTLGASYCDDERSNPSMLNSSSPRDYTLLDYFNEMRAERLRDNLSEYDETWSDPDHEYSLVEDYEVLEDEPDVDLCDVGSLFCEYDDENVSLQNIHLFEII